MSVSLQPFLLTPSPPFISPFGFWQRPVICSDARGARPQVPTAQVQEMFRHWADDTSGNELTVDAWTGVGSDRPAAIQHEAQENQTPLRFNAIKILNSLSYNPAMRDELKAAGAVDALVLHHTCLRVARAANDPG